MSRRTSLLLCVVAALFFFGTPVVAFAQQDAGIIGVVTDESGAVLPGVTVTVTGPASPGGRCGRIRTPRARFPACRGRPDR